MVTVDMDQSRRLEDLRTVVFACTGNTCRSPMAQKILIEKAKARGIDIRVHSRRADVEVSPSGYALDSGEGDLNAWLAGTKLKSKILEPMGTSRGTAAVLESVYGDTEFAKGHRSKQFTRSDLREADLVMTMDLKHKQKLIGYEEAWTERGKLKVYTLGELVGEPMTFVSDPAGQDFEAIEELLPSEVRDELKLARSAGRESVVNINDYVTPTQQLRSSAEAYMPTFEQLSMLIEGVLDLEELPSETFQEIFMGDLQIRYNEAKKDGKPLRKIGKRVAKVFTPSFVGKKQSPHELFRNGDYGSSARALSKEVENAVDRYSRIENSFEKVATSFDNGEILRLAKGYDQTLREVLPALITGDTYLDRNWNVDNRAVADQIGYDLIAFAEYVPALIERADLRQSFMIQQLTNQALGVVGEMTQKDSRVKMLATILGISNGGEE